MVILEVIFWACTALILWTYIGYPLVLRFADSGESPDIDVPTEEMPHVDVIFAAYNEESVIREKIHSIFRSNYPGDRIHVYIGSDASTDQTDDIIRELQQEYPQLHLIRMPGRTGKSGIINHLVTETRSELILGTDANIFFTPEMIGEMVKHIKGDVHLVGGNIIYRDARKEGIAPEEKLYLSFENKIKQRESNLWNAVMGVEGGCYLIRRDAFTVIPPLTFMEDFFLTLSVLRKGGKVRFESKAVCTEDISVDRLEEFKRKVRISLGNYQNLRRFKGMIMRPLYPVGFAFLSHKVLRWITPILLLVTLITSAVLANLHPMPLYFAAFAVQLALLMLFGIDLILPERNSRSSLIRFVGHFYLMNFALLKGLIIYLQGVETNVWQPTKRAQKRS